MSSLSSGEPRALSELHVKVQSWANNCAVYEEQCASETSKSYHRGAKEAFQRVADALLAQPAPPRWQCEQCANLNYGTDAKCVNCGAYNPYRELHESSSVTVPLTPCTVNSHVALAHSAFKDMPAQLAATPAHNQTYMDSETARTQLASIPLPVEPNTPIPPVQPPAPVSQAREAEQIVERANKEICRLAGTITAWPPLHDEVMTKCIAEALTAAEQRGFQAGLAAAKESKWA